MNIVKCIYHNLDIEVYEYSEQDQFIDNNSPIPVVFVEDNQNKYLKRGIINKCDEKCFTIKKLLNNEE